MPTTVFLTCSFKMHSFYYHCISWYYHKLKYWFGLVVFQPEEVWEVFCFCFCHPFTLDMFLSTWRHFWLLQEFWLSEGTTETWYVKSRDAAKYCTMHRTVSPSKEVFGPEFKLRNPISVILSQAAVLKNKL